MEYEHNDYNGADIAALIEQFERYLQTNEYFYADEEGLEMLLEYYENRNLPEREEAVIDLALQQNPFSTDFLVRKAEFLLTRKRYKEALESLDKAQMFDSREVDIYLIRSDIYVEQNRIEEAEAVLQEALAIADNSDKDSIYAELSDIYEIQEQFGKAFEALAKALKYNPSSEEALHKLAHIVDMTDRYDESVALHTEIIDKDPYAWLAWYNLGRAYVGLGLYEKAMEAFEYVMAIEEMFDLVYRDAADIYYRMEQFEKAIAMFETAHEKSIGYEDYSFRIGLCYERLSNYRSARFHYRKAARQDPYMHEAFFRIGETYRMEERLDPALVNYKKALHLDETNEDYICTIISIYKMLDREEEVLEHMYMLVQARPDILNYWLDYLIYLFEVQQYEKAVEVSDAAIRRCGHYAEFYYLQSVASAALGDMRSALILLEHALSLDYARHTILYEASQEIAMLPAFQKIIHQFGSN